MHASPRTHFEKSHPSTNRKVAVSALCIQRVQEERDNLLKVQMIFFFFLVQITKHQWYVEHDLFIFL